MSTLVLPAGASYVAGAFLSTVFLLMYQTRTVGKYRGRAGVEYPRAYADKEEMKANPNAVLFNCAQRAHQNTLENLPMLLIGTAITSLKYPHAAAAALTVWSISRVGYTVGYTTGTPKKRTNALSVFQYPVGYGLLLASTYTVVQLVRAELNL
ncbi:hypothetical protein C8F04DRAFT_1109899 [Mycena alexandri]|uniref:Membrane-associated proteins in eicosanoid and glutathione metabolism n=1 Tax=Mycena alexandri TaxID=1745969 RepID=A0AAD6X1Q3_9AGAR|nr:hypothetical protein C8F04DRAFT_1109899 [Mycena alexandri]